MWRTLPGPVRKLIVGVIAPMVAIWLLLWLWGDRHYRRAIPEDVPVLAMLSATNGFTCGGGGAIFALRPGSGDRIKREGVAALGQPGVGRGYAPNTRKGVYYTWSPWTPTPIAFPVDGFWPGLNCLEAPQKDQIIEALAQPGSWVSYSRAGELMVIPSLNLAVFTFFD